MLNIECRILNVEVKATVFSYHVYNETDHK
jgi:hypothetical protein